MKLALATVRFTLVWALLVGLLWPTATTFVGGLLFPDAAAGSLIERDGHVVGSRLVAQPFADARYLVGRPSACSHDPTKMAGSNLAPSNPALRDRAKADAEAIAAREGVPLGAIPADLVAASGSCLDPDVSLAGAHLQIPRVARARHVTDDAVAAVIDAHVVGGLFGAERVNVLETNLALDEAFPGVNVGAPAPAEATPTDAQPPLEPTTP